MLNINAVVTNKKSIFCILASIFILRLLAGLRLADQDYFINGYSAYYYLAKNYLESGKFFLEGPFGLYYSNEVLAIRPPLYPLFIAIILSMSNGSAEVFIFVQIFISIITVYLTCLIASRVFDQIAGFFALLFCGFHPYLFIHAAKLQENTLYECFVLTAVYFLLRALEASKKRWIFSFGLFSSLAILTRVTFVLQYVFIILGVTTFFFKFKMNRAIKLITISGSVIVCLILPWMTRNYQSIGMFSLTSQIGHGLSVANNPYTFSYFPYKGSIDMSEGVYKRHMEDNGELETLRSKLSSEKEYSRYFKDKAVRYIVEDPLKFIKSGCQKITVLFSGIMSPLSPSSFKNGIYFLTYWFLTILALLGIKQNYQSPLFLITIALIISHLIYTFVFWSHASHRSYLEPFWCIYASAGVRLIFKKIVTS